MKAEAPDFTAYELNHLQSLALRSEYYRKAHKFVMDFVDDFLKYETMSEKQQKWLWGIKAEMRESVEG